MRPLQIGLVLFIGDHGAERETLRWHEIREQAIRAEQIGNDSAAPGYTRVEIMLSPPTIESLEALAPVLELLDSD